MTRYVLPPGVELLPGDVVLYQPGGLIGDAIALVERCEWTHAALVAGKLGKGYLVIEAWPVHARINRIERDVPFVVYRPREPLTADQMQAAQQYAYDMIGEPYDLGAIAEQFLRYEFGANPPPEHHGRICSMLAAAFLEPIAGRKVRPGLNTCSPADLAAWDYLRLVTRSVMA